jgi:NADPH:quinone reductase-like Zn-dependent oxidoreductase
MPFPIPDSMRAVLLTGHGGVEMLQCRDDVPVPRPGLGEVLIRVAAAGVNNTDINTRIGWYARSTDEVGGAVGGWAGALDLPRIQGADCCGHIVAVGPGVPSGRVGQRVIVATMQQSPGGEPFATVTLGSEMDGAFAEFMVARSSETHAVRCAWTDVELASIPCATSTAENMLRRARVAAGERVLITGASGGVGTAAIQLARRRGAHVIAVASASKASVLGELGADDVVPRGDDPVAAIGAGSIEVVVDLVGGPGWPQLLDLLGRGGRYVASGAIAGPLVELDLRTLYLNDLTLLGATYQEPDLFDDLVRYIELCDIRPLVHATYPLERIADAQADFVAKDHVGKLVLTVST